MVFTNVDRRMTGAWSRLVVELSETLTARSWNLWEGHLTSSGCGAPRAAIKIIGRSWYFFYPATFILKFYTCLLSTTLNLVQLVLNNNQMDCRYRNWTWSSNTVNTFWCFVILKSLPNINFVTNYSKQWKLIREHQQSSQCGREEFKMQFYCLISEHFLCFLFTFYLKSVFMYTL